MANRCVICVQTASQQSRPFAYGSLKMLSFLHSTRGRAKPRPNFTPTKSFRFQTQRRTLPRPATASTPASGKHRSSPQRSTETS
ncbi:hypothetical protein [Caudoviricetes sp.]|nr:hypothetical protein [Caudoviricetes sp.]